MLSWFYNDCKLYTQQFTSLKILRSLQFNLHIIFIFDHNYIGVYYDFKYKFNNSFLLVRYNKTKQHIILVGPT